MRYAVKIAYDGTRFSGSQRQPSVRTVDGECIMVLKKIGAITGPTESRYQSASRTDAGVSAAGNVICFNTDISKRALLGAFNSYARDVWAWSVATVPDDFNARLAKQRWYRYHMPPELDVERAKGAAKLFIGRHDFRWFTRVKTGTVKTIDSLLLQKRRDFLLMDVKAQSFLWGMVRRIAACLESYCLGEIDLHSIEGALSGEKNDFGLARPEPLVLVDVDYGIEFERLPFGKVNDEITRQLDEACLESVRWNLIAQRLGIR